MLQPALLSKICFEVNRLNQFLIATIIELVALLSNLYSCWKKF